MDLFFPSSTYKITFCFPSYTKNRLFQQPVRVSQTSRTGFLYLDHLLHRLRFDSKADQIFGAPGSNRGIKASVYLRTLIYMMFDGAWEDVRALDEDEALKELCPLEPPTGDALGDWLRRHGTEVG
jgi:hypothetical protein